MSIWIIVSWICVAILTAINVVVFMKLKGASEQMMKMAFPNAKNMNDALSQMQGMMGAMGGGMGGMGGGRAPARGGNPFAAAAKGAAGGKGGGKSNDAQLKAAMDMLAKIQKNGGKHR